MTDDSNQGAKRKLELQVESFPLRPGDRVGSKYVVDAIIGEGGVAIVVAAQNIELDERVALKFLRPEMLNQREVVARFMLEAKAASGIKSEYVASVFDVGTFTSEDAGYTSPFLVMEYLEGQDLDDVLLQRKRLDRREATEYAMQACEALAAAHARGIVHRDIKPANLFVTTRGGMRSIKVLDFGISKAVLAGSILGSSVPLVDTISLMGSPLYMSPEQVRSAASVDPRSDIWSLGIVLYEMLTGSSPFKRGSLTEICAAILEASIPSLDDAGIPLPPGYSDVVARCLRKDPSERFANVAELARALLPFAPSRSRICAERAARALVSAGLLDEDAIRFSSAPPVSQDSLPQAVIVPPLDPLYRRDEASTPPLDRNVMSAVVAPEQTSDGGSVPITTDDEPEETPATISSSSPLAWSRGRSPDSRQGAAFEPVAGSALEPNRPGASAVPPAPLVIPRPPAVPVLEAVPVPSREVPPRSRRGWFAAASAASLLAILIGVGFALRGGAPPAPTETHGPVPTTPIAPAASIAPAAASAPPVTPAPRPTTTATPAPTIADDPPKASPAPVARPRTRPGRMPVLGASATGTATDHPPAASADCNPPYYFVGTKKIFKAQCL